jgi:hypothetical protein
VFASGPQLLSPPKDPCSGFTNSRLHFCLEKPLVFGDKRPLSLKEWGLLCLPSFPPSGLNQVRPALGPEATLRLPS